jgi:predicted peroxiredoxin
MRHGDVSIYLREDKMASILVHITHGTEHPTRAALGFHVAKAAIEEGHSVTMFLAGDGVQLMRNGAIDHLKGLGTGNLRDLYDAVVLSGVIQRTK